MSEKKNVPVLDFVTAVQSSNTAQEAVDKLAAQGFEITKNSLQARASKYRQPEYKKIPLIVDGKPVLKEDKKTPVLVDFKDGDGNKVVVRPALPLKKFARGGGVKLTSQMDDILAAIAAASDDTE